MKISKEIVDIPVNSLVKSNLNPRKDVGNLAYLSDTIDKDGIIEPLIVIKRNGTYEVIVGERRREAAISLKLETLPCRLAELSDEESLVLIAIEDFQRKELTEMEKAVVYNNLSKTMTYDDIAARIGTKTESYIKKIVSLLQLDPIVQNMVLRRTMDIPEEKTLTYSKAVVLIPLPYLLQKAVADLVINDGMTDNALNEGVRNIKSVLNLASNKEDTDKLITEINANLVEVMDQGQLFFTGPTPAEVTAEDKAKKSKFHRHVFLLTEEEVITILGACEKYLGRVPKNYPLR